MSIRLKEWDWNAQAYVEIEYDEQAIQAFVNWFRTTKQWRENPEMAYSRWLKLERELVKVEDAMDSCSQMTAKGKPCKGKAVKDGLCMAHLKQLAA